MKLPRLSNVYTVRFLLKGGNEVTHDLRDFSFKGNSEEITSIKWVSDDDWPFYVSLSEIAAVKIQSKRIRFRFRDKKSE